MSQQTVNENCTANNFKKLPEDFEGWTLVIPEPGYHGNLKHFFQKPNDKLMMKLMYKDKKEKAPYKAPYHRFLGNPQFI